MATILAFHAHPDDEVLLTGGRLFRLLVALPVPVYGFIAGREWFAEPGAAPAAVGDQVLRPASPVSPPGR